MPAIGSTSKRDYVIIGHREKWESEAGLLPVALELTDGQRQTINKETFDWICRGLDLSNLGSGEAGEFEITGSLELSDGNKEEVLIKVEIVH